MDLRLPDASPPTPPDEPAAAGAAIVAHGVETPGLHIHGVGKSFGKRKVLEGVSFSVHRGEVAGLLGPNGAGKTTCFYIITGLVKPDAGLIYLDGNNLTATPMYQRARMGISYLAQEASIFRGMSVEQNVLSVAELHERDGRRAQALVDGLLEELHIAHLRKMPAISLSGGERRRVEIARALAIEPSFLLMDEPFAGLDPLAVDDIRKIVTQLKDRGLGILITDHNVKETLDIVDVASVIYDGSVLLEGTPQEILSDPEVRRVYLGKAYADAIEQGRAEPRGAARRRPSFIPPIDTGWLTNERARDGAPASPRSLAFKGVIAGLALCLTGGVLLGAQWITRDREPVEQPAPAAPMDYAAALKVVDAGSNWMEPPLEWRRLPSIEAAGRAPVTFAMPTTPYAYGGVSAPLSNAIIDGDTIIRVDVSDVRGTVGASLVNPAGEPLITSEQALTPASGRRAVFFRLSDADLPAAVLFRNYGDTSAKPGSVTVRRVRYASVQTLSEAELHAIEVIGSNKPVKPDDGGVAGPPSE